MLWDPPLPQTQAPARAAATSKRSVLHKGWRTSSTRVTPASQGPLDTRQRRGGGGTYHEQLQQQHQQKQQALGRWLLAGCTVVGEASCRDIGRGVSADAGPAYWNGHTVNERNRPQPRVSTWSSARDPHAVTCCDLLPAPALAGPGAITSSPASQPHTRWTGLGRAPGALLLLRAPPSPRVSPRLKSLRPPGWSLWGGRGAALRYHHQWTPALEGLLRALRGQRAKAQRKKRK